MDDSIPLGSMHRLHVTEPVLKMNKELQGILAIFRDADVGLKVAGNMGT